MELRYYQRLAVLAIYAFLRSRAGNPCVVLPTGSGKSLVIAQLCADAVTAWGGRVLVLAHVKELIEQNAAELRALCPGLDVGVYSAGLNSRETASAVVVAGIQSVYRRALELGHFDLVVIDEAHLISEAGDSMYQSLIRGVSDVNPDARIIGLTATPYRLGSGMICGPDAVLSEVCYEVGVKELVGAGFLCPLVGKAAANEIDTAKIAVRRGEFDEDAAEAAFTAGDEVARAVNEIGLATAGRASVLLFCQSVYHAGRVAAELTRWLNERWLPGAVALVYGDMDAGDRARILAGFKSGDVKYVVNVNVLTTGFNAKNVDCVCLLRATQSPGLYYQMLGRGFRLWPAKADTLVLDFGRNIQRHGPVDAILAGSAAGPARADGDRGKVCPDCRTVVGTAAAACPGCGSAFPPPAAPEVAPHDGTAAADDPLSGKPKVTDYPVTRVTYRVHRKKGAGDDAPKTMRVTYQVSLAESFDEWVCVEHDGYAGDKARNWWAERCRLPVPDTAVEAAAVAQCGLLAVPRRVSVKNSPGKTFANEVVRVELGPPPDGPAPCPRCRSTRRVVVRHPQEAHPGQVVCGDCSAHFDWASHDVVAHYGFFGEPGSRCDDGIVPGGTPGGVWDDDPAVASVAVAPAADDEIPF